MILPLKKQQTDPPQDSPRFPEDVLILMIRWYRFFWRRLIRTFVWIDNGALFWIDCPYEVVASTRPGMADMAKSNTPFLSLSAHGSVGGSLTAQAIRGGTSLRTKPLPTDPYSIRQAYQRWTYRDYAYLWTLQTQATRQEYATAGSPFHLTGFQYWIKAMLSTRTDIAGWWPLDERGGNQCLDRSSYLNHAAIIGATPVTGMIDGGYLFDGLNDLMSVPDSPSLRFGTAPFTVMCFFRPDLSQNSCVVGRMPNLGWVCGFLTTGRLTFYYRTASGSYYQTTFPGVITDSQNHVAAWLIDPPNLSVRFFVDGVLVRTRPLAADINFNQATPLLFGRNAWWNYWHKGMSDNVILWNRLLDTTEIERWSERRYP